MICKFGLKCWNMETKHANYNDGNQTLQTKCQTNSTHPISYFTVTVANYNDGYINLD